MKFRLSVLALVAALFVAVPAEGKGRNKNQRQNLAAAKELNIYDKKQKLETIETEFNKLEKCTPEQAKDFILEINALQIKPHKSGETNEVAAKKNELLKKLQSIVPKTASKKTKVQDSSADGSKGTTSGTSSSPSTNTDNSTATPFYKNRVFWMIGGGSMTAVAIVGGAAYAFLSKSKVEQNSDVDTPSEDDLEQSDA